MPLLPRSRRSGSRATLGPVLTEGDRIPEVEVWTAPNRAARLAELLEGRPALIFFYLFDWSGT